MRSDIFLRKEIGNEMILERYCPIVEKNVVLQTQQSDKTAVKCLNLKQCNGECKNIYRIAAV